MLVEWQVKGGKTTGWWTISNDQAAAISPTVKNEKKGLESPGLVGRFLEALLGTIAGADAGETILPRYVQIRLRGPCAYAADLPAGGVDGRQRQPPPWKGDFHHDLNTQLSYWPGYTANHTDLTEGFTTWLWNTRAENERYTKHYFGVEGLNVPGVNTITGKPMGGWIQYSFSPTVAAWLAQHFYWQWKFTGDETFLRERAKPWFDRVALFLRNIRVKDPAIGVYKLPLSSSPEYNDNSLDAWFLDYSNYDLALIRFFFTAYAEIGAAAGTVLYLLPMRPCRITRSSSA